MRYNSAAIACCREKAVAVLVEVKALIRPGVLTNLVRVQIVTLYVLIKMFDTVFSVDEGEGESLRSGLVKVAS